MNSEEKSEGGGGEHVVNAVNIEDVQVRFRQILGLKLHMTFAPSVRMVRTRVTARVYAFSEV